MNSFVFRVVIDLGARIITKAAQPQESYCYGKLPDRSRHWMTVWCDDRLHPAEVHADDCWLRHGFLLPRILRHSSVMTRASDQPTSTIVRFTCYDEGEKGKTRDQRKAWRR